MKQGIRNSDQERDCQRSSTNKELSERQEQLLMKHADGECCFWERWIAHRLLSKKDSAQRFLADMETLHADVRQSCEQVDCRCSVWSGVDQRIDQEKRTALFLGERKFDDAQRIPATLRNLFARPAAAWTVSAVAASCAIVLSYQGLMPADYQGIPPSAVAGTKSAGFVAAGSSPGNRSGFYPKQLVANSDRPTAGGGGYVAPRILEERIPSTMEVDWLRGNGRVRLIPDAETRAPIIWVKRRTPNFSAAASARPEATLAVTPMYGFRE